jgi:ComF family protein
VISSLVPKAWAVLLDFVYPPRCGGCDLRGTLFCVRCTESIKPPPENDRNLPGIETVISAGGFEGPLRSAIHKLKYEGDTPLARPLARFIYGAIEHSEALDAWGHEAPVIVSVPLHKARQRMRGFNQSELICRELAVLTGWRIERSLVRVKNTRSQVGLNAQERLANMRGAFAWVGSEIPQRVLLVDDVCTSGATLSECAATLRDKGALEIYAATAGRALGRGPQAGS